MKPVPRRDVLTAGLGLSLGLSLGLPLLGACTSMSATGKPADAVFDNIATPSESVHTAVVSPDGQWRFTTRLCRYPDLGLAWVWAHARTPHGFFSYVNHLAPCGKDQTPATGNTAAYSDLARSLTFTRTGPSQLPTHVSAHVACRAFAGDVSRFGDGPHSLSADIAFTPARAYTGLNAGRTEVFGHNRVDLTIDGKRLTIEGPGQYHEQRQTTPRFTTPFAYVMLWNEDMASTLLVTPNRRDGYLLEGGKSFDAEVLRLDPPAMTTRKLAVKLSDGRLLEGEMKLVEAYTLQITGKPWLGHYLSGDLGGRKVHGNINDWMADRISYPSGK